MSEQAVALITGGAQGIGYACAEAIAESGARIVLADINGEGVTAAADKLGAAAVTCDIGDEEQIEAMFERVFHGLVEAIAEGQSEDDVVRANPAEPFAFGGPGTERWLRAAYKEYVGR